MLYLERVDKSELLKTAVNRKGLGVWVSHENQRSVEERKGTSRCEIREGEEESTGE